MKDAIKFIYFDVGDVLLIKEVEHESEVYAKTLNVNQETVEKILDQFYSQTNPEAVYLTQIYRNIRIFKDEIEYFTLKHIYLLKQIKDFNVDLELVKKLNDELFWFIYTQKKLNSNSIQILDYLQSKNYEMGVLSNAFPGRPQFDMEPLGLTKYFSQFVISGRLGIRKPEAEIYKIAIQKSNCKPSQIAFIDDKLENLVAAKEAGFGILFWLNNSEKSQVEIPEGITKIRNLIEIKEYLF